MGKYLEFADSADGRDKIGREGIVKNIREVKLNVLEGEFLFTFGSGDLISGTNQQNVVPCFRHLACVAER